MEVSDCAPPVLPESSTRDHGFTVLVHDDRGVFEQVPEADDRLASVWREVVAQRVELPNASVVVMSLPK